MLPKYVDDEIRSGLAHAYLGGLKYQEFKRLENYGLIDNQGSLTEKGKNLRNEIINTPDIVWNMKRFRQNNPQYKASLIK